VPRIRILSDRLVSQIAAGEVVERPASVVKELVENALDAGARELEIDLVRGGAGSVRVADDGRGMDRDDALLAFDRHATSKIGSFEDLERVGTLGFRGEALASIAAVSRVELSTAEAPGAGTRVRIEGGRVVAVEPAARARGTTVEVASLFWNVPARRKFLKTKQTELRRCLEVVEGYALARPDVAWIVRHEGRSLLEAPGFAADGAGATARIAQLFGPELAAELVAIGGEDDGIGGFVGSPATARGRRSFVFVNRRLVRDRALLAAFYRAVREEWRSDEFPSLFLFLELEPDRVDVNVHPQKAEVRFRDSGFPNRVAERLREALGRARGEEAAPLRTLGGPPRGALGWEGLGGRGDAPPDELREPAARGPEEDLSVQDKDRDKDKDKDLLLKGRGDGAAPETSGGGAARAREAFPFHGSFSSSEGAGGTFERTAATELGASDRSASGLSVSGRSAVDPGAARIAVAALAPLSRAPVPLSGRSGEVRPFRLLGQYKGTLVLLEGPDGLYLLDQHVAHERILYERLRRNLESRSPASQRLVTPLLLELSRAETLRLSELAPALGEAGFELEELSGGTLAVAAAPAALGPEEARGLLLAVATDPEADPATLRRRLLDDFAASMACKAAVKMHHPLGAEALEALVSELFRAENPYACPHGRPVVLLLSDADLERRFGRR
jgi:DNA mismatch repair protein MutL